MPLIVLIAAFDLRLSGAGVADVGLSPDVHGLRPSAIAGLELELAPQISPVRDIAGVVFSFRDAAPVVEGTPAVRLAVA